ncbi:MAG: DMT family transporter [Deltaproteobacteria bacterium]|nr:DMT family transporter [Deltaproteobacteria bacterium]
MTWVLLALGAAILAAAMDAVAKATVRVASPWVVAWAPYLFGAPFLLFLLLSEPDRVTPGAPYFAATALALPLEIVAVFLYIHAIHRSPLALTIPFLALTPVFTIPVSYVLVGEKPGAAGAMGVLLVTAGAYALNIQARATGWLGPFRAVAREPGSRMMIGVALLFSFTSTLGKIAVLHSSPVFFGATYSSLLLVTVGAVAARFSPGIWGAVRTHLGPLAVIGALYAAMAVCHFKAIALAPVAYMIALKRTSILFAVILGRVFFEERGLRHRFFGAALMVGGAILIAIS